MKSLKWFLSGVSEKTSWEWMELLLVPMFFAGGAFYLESRIEKRQELASEERYKQESQIADERSKQETLASYFEQMKELLLDRQLRESEEDSEVRSVARAVTTTTTQNLGSEQNALLVNFLRESNLIQKDNEITRQPKDATKSLLSGIELSDTDLGGVDLSEADLSEAFLINTDLRGTFFVDTNLRRAVLIDADLSEPGFYPNTLKEPEWRLTNDLNETDWSSAANLSRADLSKANLSGSNLNRATLRGAGLQEAVLFEANLKEANLKEANLKEAHLGSTDLSGAGLIGANLSQAYLVGSNLFRANLSDANLSEADLFDANLSGVNLSDANLSGADLLGVDLSEAMNTTKEQVSQARLCGTQLPEHIDLDIDRDCE